MPLYHIVRGQARKARRNAYCIADDLFSMRSVKTIEWMSTVLYEASRKSLRERGALTVRNFFRTGIPGKPNAQFPL